MPYPSGRVIQTGYDVIGRLCGVAVATANGTCSSVTSPYVYGFTYNAADQTTQFVYGNGVGASFAYSTNRSQLTSIAYDKTTCIQGGGCSDNTLFSLAYGYTQGQGNNDRITSITDNVDNGRSATYTYDSLSRLASATTVGSTNYPQWGLTWTYDRYGNRPIQHATAGSVPQPSHTIDPSSNHIIDPGFNVDANGNMLFDGLNTLTYDAANHLISTSSNSSSGTYVYDGNGRRVEKTGGTATTVYIFYGTNVIAEYTLGANPSSPSEEYIHAGGKLIATLDSATKYHLHDHLSIRVTTDSNGNIIGQQGLLPFGDSWYQANTSTKWMFTDQERDAESGLDELGRRYYGSSIGRFTSIDPIMISSRRLFNPQIWNMYSYVGNDPLNSIDPLGEEQVQLGQHTDQEIKDLKKAIDKQLKATKKGDPARAKLNAAKNTLDLEKQGNAVGKAYLAALQKVGQLNGLKLSDLTLTTNVKQDFANDPRMTPDKMAKATNPNAQAFVLGQGEGGPIYLKAEGSLYQLGIGNSQNEDIGGSILAHEQVHIDNAGEETGGEAAAYTRQKNVFQLFRNDFASNMDRFNKINDQLRGAIEDAKAGGH